VLVGTERVTRAGLRMLIESQPGLSVTGEIDGPDNGIPIAWSAGPPQVALVDLDGAESFDYVARLQRITTGTVRVVVLTGAPDSPACSTAVQRGALGVVSKQQAPEVLAKAIEKVHAGEVWLERSRIADVVGELLKATAAKSEPPAAKSAPLAKRERQIITLVAQGFRNTEIAARLFVSEATVRNCLASIFRKLAISSRVHLMIYAFQEGLVTLPASGGPPAPSSRRDLLRLAASRPAPDRTDPSLPKK
jgi:DNA-binding NarL/FixJ family response regulator